MKLLTEKICAEMLKESKIKALESNKKILSSNIKKYLWIVHSIDLYIKNKFDSGLVASITEYNFSYDNPHKNIRIANAQKGQLKSSTVRGVLSKYKIIFLDNILSFKKIEATFDLMRLIFEEIGHTEKLSSITYVDHFGYKKNKKIAGRNHAKNTFLNNFTKEEIQIIKNSFNKFYADLYLETHNQWLAIESNKMKSMLSKNTLYKMVLENKKDLLNTKVKNHYKIIQINAIKPA